jgi:hypothetical protein
MDGEFGGRHRRAALLSPEEIEALVRTAMRDEMRRDATRCDEMRDEMRRARRSPHATHVSSSRRSARRSTPEPRTSPSHHPPPSLRHPPPSTPSGRQPLCLGRSGSHSHYTKGAPGTYTNRSGSHSRPPPSDARERGARLREERRTERQRGEVGRTPGLDQHNPFLRTTDMPSALRTADTPSAVRSPFVRAADTPSGTPGMQHSGACNTAVPESPLQPLPTAVGSPAAGAAASVGRRPAPRVRGSPNTGASSPSVPNRGIRLRHQDSHDRRDRCPTTGPPLVSVRV